MILLRTCDENGKVQFVTVKNDMFYLECKHCGRIFPIGSICEFMEELGDENFDSEVLDWCEDCLVQKFLNKWTIFLFCSILFSSNQKEH